MGKMLKKIWAWMCDEDWIVIAIPGAILGALLFVTKQWCLLGLGITIVIATVIWELICIKTTGMSMSDQIRNWKTKSTWNMFMTRCILFAIGGTMLALIFHFSVNVTP